MCSLVLGQDEFVLGQRIRVLRKQAGLSVVELAERSGIPEQQVIAIEWCRKRPASKVLTAIARVLGIAATEFFTDHPG